MIDKTIRNFTLLESKLGHLRQGKGSNKLDRGLKLRLNILTGFTFLTIILALLLTLVFIPLAWGVKNLPAPQGLINDFAGIIPPSYEEKMNLLAREVLNKTGATLTVVTFKDIGGANIDEFTNQLYEKWGVGKKGEDRGVMILLALKERRIRIEVGYGLEEIIPDGLARQIMDQALVPYLKKGEYGLGLLNGLYTTASIIAKDKGIKLTGLPSTPSLKKQKKPFYDLSVSSSPSGASIYLDGDYGGETPTIIKVKEGVHNIEIKKDGFQTVEETFNLGSNESVFHTLKREGLAKPEPKVSPKLSERDTTPPRIYLSQRAIEIVSSAKKTVRGQAIDESGVALVYVNNREAQIDEKGNFQADILLKPGLNNIVIEAIDIYNNKATKTFIMTRKSQVAKKIEPKEDILNIKGKYYAFVIGINNYKYLDRLQTAVNDAKEVERVLRDSYGFETTILVNQRATRGNIVSELNNLRRKLDSDDKLLIYYAGHGYFDENTKKAYWLPVDAEKSNDTNWIMAERITSNLKRIPAKHILVVSDSCYSGTLTRTAQVDLFSKKTRLSYINKILNKEARVLIASGGNEPVADSGGGGHSVFAEAFIKALKQADRKVFLAEELFVGYIKEPVAGKADQTPEYSLIKNSGHAGGDFIFIKKSF